MSQRLRLPPALLLLRLCRALRLPLQAQSVSQMVDACLALPEGTRLMVLARVPPAP